jgi:hypothetical protein
MNRPTFQRASATGLVFSLLAALLIGGCAAFSSEEGVENSWRDLPEATFRQGITTQAKVAELLGPPSQIISLASGTAFCTQEIRYDRAVFFFDRNGILTHHAIRNDIAPEEP